MEKLIFTNGKGESIELDDTSPYILSYISGAGGINSDVQMQKAPYQSGKSYIDSVIDERLISLNIVIMSKSETERFQYRKDILRVFNPKLGEGTLKYVFDSGEKEIKTVVKTSPVFKTDDIEAPEEHLETLVNLIAPSPFWLDTFEESKEMAAWIGGLKFLFKLPTTFSMEGSTVTINNAGNVDTPVYIEFYGPASNPKIENLTTGEFIRIKKDLLQGETLKINTSFGNKYATIDDSNAFHYIDLESTFWQLKPGENEIKYSADSDQDQAKVKITYRNRYLGV